MFAVDILISMYIIAFPSLGMFQTVEDPFTLEKADQGEEMYTHKHVCVFDPVCIHAYSNARVYDVYTTYTATFP